MFTLFQFATNSLALWLSGCAGALLCDATACVVITQMVMMMSFYGNSFELLSSKK